MGNSEYFKVTCCTLHIVIVWWNSLQAKKTECESINAIQKFIYKHTCTCSFRIYLVWEGKEERSSANISIVGWYTTFHSMIDCGNL